jgi:hypothetical protein
MGFDGIGMVRMPQGMAQDRTLAVVQDQGRPEMGLQPLRLIGFPADVPPEVIDGSSDQVQVIEDEMPNY